MDKFWINCKKPQYSHECDCWSYSELKDFFDGISCVPFKMAACNFLSNVEGMGDFLDKHPFFDFQGYLIIAAAGLREEIMFRPGSAEYNDLKEGIDNFMSGRYDGWTMSKEDLAVMKKDCRDVGKIYFKEKK